jgi:MYXO-CTERM domain-containing protein
MTTVRTRLAACLFALVALVGTAMTVGVPAAHAQTSSRAVVIVSTGSGVHTEVIEFSGTISGMEALQLAGASPETITYGSLGQAVCKLYGAGDEPVPGQCPGGWVYYRAVGGAGGWSQSSIGASNSVVHDGDVEGWGYGGAPPFSSFCAVAGCAPPPTTPTAPTVSGGGVGGVSGGSIDTSSPGGTVAGGPAGGPTDPATAATNPAGTGAGDSTPSAVATAHASTGVGRRVGRIVAAGNGSASTAADSGSPVGVVVAGAVVAVLVGAGLLLRRRRRL